MPEPTIPQVSIVGSETLLGTDLRELLRESILGSRLKLLGSVEEGAAILSAEEDEPVVIAPIDEEELNSSRIVFLTGPAEVNQKAFTQIRQGPTGPVVIDLTRSLEDHPSSRLRAPMAEPAGTTASTNLHVIAHPAAILIATLLQRLATVGTLRRSVVTAFEPASERGMAGIEELQQQTVALLSFKQQNKAIYDEQLAFNVLARFGDEAPLSLQSIQEGIESHLVSLLSPTPTVPMPNLRLLQTAVMHGTTASLWVLFAERPDLGAIEAALNHDPFDFRGEGTTQPNPVGMASQTGISAGALEADRNEARAVWVHAAADNFRIVSQNAISVATGILIGESLK
ncbi:MAG: Asd/ArgC dimerization domain-containing protein [Acidobacteriota bacterium]